MAGEPFRLACHVRRAAGIKKAGDTMIREQTMSVVAIVMVAGCICLSGCASRSVRMDGRGDGLLDQARVAHEKSPAGAGIPIEVKGWGTLEHLPSALEKRGYGIGMTRPVYSVEGDIKMSIGPNMGHLIFWDVLMAIPSLVLPVPIMGSYTCTLDITISDGATMAELSQIEKTFNYRLTGYSLWGIVIGSGKFHEDLTAIAAMLTDEELKKLAAKSGS